MKKFLSILLMALSIGQAAIASEIKFSQLPLGTSSAVNTNDSFPYVDSGSDHNKRLTLGSIYQLPSLSTHYATIISPTFSGTVTIPSPFTLGSTSVSSTGTQLNYLNSSTGTTGDTSTNLVFSTTPTLTSPTLITPALGTPTALVGTNITGTGASFTAGMASTVATAALVGSTTFYPTLAPAAVSSSNALKSSTSLTWNSNTNTLSAAGFLSAGVLQSTTVTGVAPITVNSTTRVANLNVDTAGNADTVTSNHNMTGPITGTANVTSITSQTGTGTKFVVDNAPTLITPVLGVATATSINKMAITAPATSSTLAVADGKTFTSSNTLTLTATDGSTLAIGTGGTLGTNAFTSTAYAPLASPTFTGTVVIPTPFTLGATSVTSTGTQLNYLSAATGTSGTTSTNLVFSTNPTFINPALGTPASGVMTNVTGTAASLTAGTANNVATAAVVGSSTFYPMLAGTSGTSSSQAIATTTSLTWNASTNTLSAAGNISSGVLISTTSTGTPPLTVGSTTNVPNLNASSLSGATFAAPGPIGSGTPSTGAHTTLSASGTFTAAAINASGVVNISGNAGVFVLTNTTADPQSLSMLFRNSVGTEKAQLGFSTNAADFTVQNETATGSLFLKTNSTTALTITSAQAATFAGTLAVTGTTNHTGRVGIGIAPTATYLTLYGANNALGSVNYERLATNGMATGDTMWTQYWANDSSLEIGRMGITALAGGQMQWSVGNMYNGGVLSNTILALTNASASISVPLTIGSGSATTSVLHGGTTGRLDVIGSSDSNGGGFTLYGSANASFPGDVVGQARNYSFKNLSGTALLTLTGGTSATFLAPIIMTSGTNINTSGSGAYLSFGVGAVGSTNIEYMYMEHDGASGASIGIAKGGTGTFRALNFYTSGAIAFTIGTGGTTAQISVPGSLVVTGATSISAEVITPRQDDASTGTVNALATSGKNYIRLSASTTITLNGMDNCVNGKRLTLQNTTGNSVTVNNNSGSASAGNKILTPAGAAITIRSQGSLDFFCDTSNSSGLGNVWIALAI